MSRQGLRVSTAKIPNFFCYTCGKTYIAEEKYPDKQFTSKEGNTIYNYPDLLSDKVQDEHNKESIVIKTKTFSNYPIEINAFYCEKCKKFFTNYESIKPYFGKTKPYISIHCEYTNNGRREFPEIDWRDGVCGGVTVFAVNKF